jgi:hypothetical protein
MYHIPVIVIKLKKKEFLSLKQGGMSVCEYLDEFTQLSRYVSEEVDNDGKKQDLFFEGLNGPIKYQLVAHNFPNFHQLVDKAILVENKCHELVNETRKLESQMRIVRNTHPRFTQQSDPSIYTRDWDVLQHPCREVQDSVLEHDYQITPDITPTGISTPHNFNEKKCYSCGEVGHIARNCPRKATHNNQKPCGKGGRSRNWRRWKAQNKNQPQQDVGSQNYVHGKVNHVTLRSVQKVQGVALGMLVINSTPVTVLFDFGATHSFVSLLAHFILYIYNSTKHEKRA